MGWSSLLRRNTPQQIPLDDDFQHQDDSPPAEIWLEDVVVKRRRIRKAIQTVVLVLVIGLIILLYEATHRSTVPRQAGSFPKRRHANSTMFDSLYPPPDTSSIIERYKDAIVQVQRGGNPEQDALSGPMTVLEIDELLHTTPLTCNLIRFAIEQSNDHNDNAEGDCAFIFSFGAPDMLRSRFPYMAGLILLALQYNGQIVGGESNLWSLYGHEADAEFTRNDTYNTVPSAGSSQPQPGSDSPPGIMVNGTVNAESSGSVFMYKLGGDPKSLSFAFTKGRLVGFVFELLAEDGIPAPVGDEQDLLVPSLAEQEQHFGQFVDILLRCAPSSRPIVEQRTYGMMRTALEERSQSGLDVASVVKQWDEASARWITDPSRKSVAEPRSIRIVCPPSWSAPKSLKTTNEPDAPFWNRGPEVPR